MDDNAKTEALLFYQYLFKSNTQERMLLPS